MRWIEVVDLRLDHVRPGQLVLGVVDPGVEPALGHELVVVEVRADRRLAVDDPIEQDGLDGGERQDDDRQADPQRTQVPARPNRLFGRSCGGQRPVRGSCERGRDPDQPSTTMMTTATRIGGPATTFGLIGSVTRIRNGAASKQRPEGRAEALRPESAVRERRRRHQQQPVVWVQVRAQEQPEDEGEGEPELEPHRRRVPVVTSPPDRDADESRRSTRPAMTVLMASACAAAPSGPTSIVIVPRRFHMSAGLDAQDIE